MNVLMLLRSELRRSAAVLAGIAAVLALSLSISIATGMTDRMLRHASAQAADRFDLLIGAKASPSSLLLGAVFLRDEPLPLVPLSVMRTLTKGTASSGQPPSHSATGRETLPSSARQRRSSPSAARSGPPRDASSRRPSRPSSAPRPPTASATKSYPCTAGRPAQDTRTTTDASRSWAGCPKAARPGTAPS